MPTDELRPHPRLVANMVSLPRDLPLDEGLDRLLAAGLRRVGVSSDAIHALGWERGVSLLAESDAEVVYLLHRAMFTLEDPEGWPVQQERVRRTLDAAAALGVGIVYATTGSGGSLDFDEAARRLCRAIAPVVEHADGLGVRLLLETTNPQFADIDLLHTVRDTVAAARATGAGVCLDVHAGWTDSSLEDLIREAAPSIGLVQLSDYVPGTRTLDRAVPGDGIIPLERIVGRLLEAGYDGPFDLELFGDQGEDDVAALRRAARYVTELLDRLPAAA
jgi:sugar phosphate isomerase/epimerase